MPRQLTELDRILEDAAKKVAEDLVVSSASSILRAHIVSDIYNAYQPVENGWVDINPQTGKWSKRVTYKPRMSLLDPDKFYHKVSVRTTADGIKIGVFVTSDATPAPSPLRRRWRKRYHGAFLDMLQKGRLGIFTNAKFKGQPFPRPAVDNAQKDIDRYQSQIEKAVQEEFQRRI